jgi:hypothetical protein
MKRFVLAVALALGTVFMCSDVASARWGYYRPWSGYYSYPVVTGGPYRVYGGPVPYSTTYVPSAPTYVGPWGRAYYGRPYYARPYVAARPYWYY